MSKHTPTPWEIGPPEVIGSPVCYMDDNHNLVIGPFGDWGENADAETDAAFIVRACNVHDDLLAACKVAEIALRREGWVWWADFCKRAIARAEGSAE